MPERGVDALAAANQILTALYASRDTLKSRTSKTPGITHPTLNVGLIAGGINTNVVPDRVTFRIDRRIIPEESPAAAEAELRALIESAAAKCAGITIEIRRLLLSLPLSLPMPEPPTPTSAWLASQSRKRSGSAPTGVLLPTPAGAADELKSAPPGERDSTWLAESELVDPGDERRC